MNQSPDNDRPHDAYGALVAAMRQAVGLRQCDLSMALGVQSGTISHIETGRVPPQVDRLRRLAVAFGVQPGEVMP
jgi:transcriptional regulator with XRE-family HTH domain